MEDGMPDVLLDVSAAVPASGGVVRVTVAGRGQAAERLAIDVAELVRTAVAQALAGGPALVARPDETGAASPPDANTGMLGPVPAFQAVSEPVNAAAAVRAAPAGAAARPKPWFQRHRSKISGAVGLFLIALALVIPLLVPDSMRREILPMPIGLGLAGAISLFSALMPDPQRRGVHAKVQVRMAAPAQPAAQTSAQRVASMAVAKPQSLARRVIGLSFGGALALAGLIAPFALPNVSADDRFLMMLGFAPIALIGVFLLWVFLRRPPTQASSARSVFPRDARSGAALAGASGALAALGVMLGLVVALVVLATVLPLLNARP